MTGPQWLPSRICSLDARGEPLLARDGSGTLIGRNRKENRRHDTYAEMPLRIETFHRKAARGWALIRRDGRRADATRPFSLETGFTRHAEGSVLARAGDTHVLCNASVEPRVPPWLKGRGRGWVTAEYAMLPRATNTRTSREVAGSRPSGRNLEIQRLIGRSLRSVVALEALGEHTVTLDCDVLQADGGTRTTAISGAFVALVLALRKLGEAHPFPSPPVTGALSSISVGIVDGLPLLDLDYGEDSTAEVDLNVVMTQGGSPAADSGALALVEVQGNAEGKPFSRADLTTMLDLAELGIAEKMAVQWKVLEGRLV